MAVLADAGDTVAVVMSVSAIAVAVAAVIFEVVVVIAEVAAAAIVEVVVARKFDLFFIKTEVLWWFMEVCGGFESSKVTVFVAKFDGWGEKVLAGGFLGARIPYI